MKKIGALLVCLILSLGIISPVKTEAATNQQIEYYDDGSYFVTVIEDETPEITPLSTTVTKSKTGSYYNSAGNILWSVKVTGTFTYGNGTSKCISSSVNTTVYGSTWKITSKSASKSGNKAIGRATAKQYIQNDCVQTINKTVTLTCSSTGTFS